MSVAGDATGPVRPAGETLTDRELFERVRAHLLAQGERSLMERPEPGLGSGCAYRGRGEDSGRPAMCAIGCLIPDAEYESEIEGQGCWSRVVWDLLARTGVLPVGHGSSAGPETRSRIDMLEELQRVHDRGAPHKWAGALDSLADGCLRADGSWNEMGRRRPPGADPLEALEGIAP